MAPEPRDPFLFVTISLAIPFVLAGAFIWSSREGGTEPDEQFIFWSIVSIAFMVLVWQGAYRQADLLFGGSTGIIFAATLVGVSLLFRAPEKRRERLIGWGISAMFPVAVILILVQRIWTDDSLLYGGPLSSHYEAVTSAVVRIASGGTCLSNVLPQYGCYGEFLAPLLRLFGNTVPVITTIFAFLLIAGAWAALKFTASIIRQPVVLLACLTCVVSATAFNLVYSGVDPILQYYPLRFLFPALSLLAAMYFQRTPTLGAAFSLGLLAGAGVAWNLESGMAVAISLAAFVMLGDFTSRPWKKGGWISVAFGNLAIYALGATMFLAAFIAYLFLKADGTIELANLIVFQQVFAVTGFGMIPLPAFPSYWTIHAAILFGTLFLATVAASCETAHRDQGMELAAYLAVLGIGLAVYYVGRSHILVLRLVMWPSIILLFFLLDRTLASARGEGARTASRAAAWIAFALSAAFFVSALPSVAKVALRARAAPPEANLAVREDIDFIRAHTTPGEAVGIVSVNQGVLYGHSDTRAALEGPGVAELIRRVDLQRLMDFLVDRGPDKLFIGTNLDTAADEALLGTNIPIDFERLETVYTSEQAPGGRLVFMERRSE